MRKSDKKIENKLRLALTNVCETALKDIQGFQWLTHTVNYDRFPESLNVICVFNTNANLAYYLKSAFSSKLPLLIQSELKTIDIKVRNINNHISYDTEEVCDKQHYGNRASRTH